MSYYTLFITAFNCILFAVCLPLLFVRGVEYVAEYSGVQKNLRPGFYKKNVYLMFVTHLAIVSLFIQLEVIKLAIRATHGV